MFQIFFILFNTLYYTNRVYLKSRASFETKLREKILGIFRIDWTKRLNIIYFPGETQHKRNQNFNFLVIKIKFKHPSILSLFIKLESHFSLVHVQDSFDRSLFDDEFERKRGEREREERGRGDDRRNPGDLLAQNESFICQCKSTEAPPYLFLRRLCRGWPAVLLPQGGHFAR